MKQKLFYFLIIIQTSLFAFEHPIKINLTKTSASNYSIQVTAPKGFAVQKDAPNKIKLSSVDKLTISQAEVKLSGKTFLDKPEYFEKIDSIPLSLSGKGKLELNAKIFYCDLNKSVCYPATIKQIEEIK